MDEEFHTDNIREAGCEALPSINTLPNNLTDTCCEVELPKIMSSLGLEENISLTILEDTATTSSNSFKWSESEVVLRRSQRKQAVPRIAVGGVTKRRCTLKQTKRDVYESDDDIKEFYENYNKKFKSHKTNSLATIYEEPKQRNEIMAWSGPVRRRMLRFRGCGPRFSHKIKTYKLKSSLLDKDKCERIHFTVEDVKKHLAQTGLVNLASP